MALVNSITPSFYGGVSQQPNEIRLENQCEEMINCIPSVANGLQRRMPANIIAELNDAEEEWGTPSMYAYDRGDRLEKYIVFVWSNGNMRVFDYLGNPQPFERNYNVFDGYTYRYIDQHDYLKCSDPTTDLDFLTIGDTTFVVNKTIPTDIVKLDEDTVETDGLETSVQYNYTPYVNLVKIYEQTKAWPTGGSTTEYRGFLLGTIKLTLRIGDNYYTSSVYINELYDIRARYFYSKIPEYQEAQDVTSFVTPLLNNTLVSASNDYPEALSNGTLSFDEAKEVSVLVEFTPDFLYTQAELDTYVYLFNPRIVDGSLSSDLDGDIINYGVLRSGANYNVVDTSNWENQFYYWVSRTDGNYPFTYGIKTNSPDYTGTVTGSSTNGHIIDNTKSWPTDGSLVGFSVRNVTQEWTSLIVSNTATDITTEDSNNNAFAGDEYEIVLEHQSDNSTTVVNYMKNKINGLGDPNFFAETSGSILRINTTNGIKLEGYDSFGNTASTSWLGWVDNMNQLPLNLGFEGAIIGIAGKTENLYDNYYVKYEDNKYIETYKPGTRFGLDKNTMPHRLLSYTDRNDTSTPFFFFSPQDNTSFPSNASAETIFMISDLPNWQGREVGDETVAPNPSFIGKPINGMFLYQQRLGFLSDNNIIFSETNNLHNFYPTTVTDVLDSDVIDVSVDTTSSVQLREAVPFNKNLLIFGDNSQYVLSVDGALSPSTVSILNSTNYNYNSNAKSLTLGPNVYFSTEKNEYSKFREYYVVPNTVINDASDISAHVPNYIPKGIIKIVGSTKHDIMFSLSKWDTKTIYVYNFMWAGNEKTQSAWHKWTFTEDVANIDLIGSKLYILFKNGFSYTLKTIEIEVPTDILSVSYADEIGEIWVDGYQIVKEYFDLYSYYATNDEILVMVKDESNSTNNISISDIGKEIDIISPEGETLITTTILDTDETTIYNSEGSFTGIRVLVSPITVDIPEGSILVLKTNTFENYYQGMAKSLYESKFVFSDWTIKPKGTIGDTRKNLKYKNVSINCDYGSYYNVRSKYKTRQNWIMNRDVLLGDGNDKFRMTGSVKDMTIEVNNYQDKGFKLTSSVFEGTYNPKGRTL